MTECCYQISTSSDDPHGKCINLFLMREFPVNPINMSSEDLLELISAEIMGTKQTRLGPKPSPETQVNIRNVIRYYMRENSPIPFAIPWGSEKPDGSGIDSAELGALKTLNCLHQRVSRIYSPGLQFNIRIEDASAPHLFHERADQARKEAKLYTSQFVSIIEILGLSSFIKPVLESSLVDEETFNRAADQILPIMLNYIMTLENGTNSNDQFEDLVAIGWKGRVAPETYNYYMSQFENVYPESNQSFKIEKLARYLSGALVRSKLGLRGDDPEWNGIFAELSFSANPPGSDSKFGRRVIYRTLPKTFTSNHIPPWRAKGYLEISDDGDICPKLASFNALKDLDLFNHLVTFKSDKTTITINLSYTEK